MNTPTQRREVVESLKQKGLSKRAACKWSGQSRRVTQYEAKTPIEDEALIKKMKQVSLAHPRYGYRRVAVLVKASQSCVWRLWKQHGFKLGRKRLKKRLVIQKGGLPRPHKAEFPDHVWTYDIIHDRLADGSEFKMLCILDEFTRECLAIYVAKSIPARVVKAVLARVMGTGRKPKYLRSDNGSQFTATPVKIWLKAAAVGPAFIDPGSPWQNGFVESFHGKLRDECLSLEYFNSQKDAEVVIEQWRHAYNTERPHSSLDYKTPAAFAAQFVNKR